jgi:hypothetical protein
MAKVAQLVVQLLSHRVSVANPAGGQSGIVALELNALQKNCMRCAHVKEAVASCFLAATSDVHPSSE